METEEEGGKNQNTERTHGCVAHVCGDNRPAEVKLVGELVGHQLVVGATGRAALGLALVKPEPDHRRVVFLTCKEGKGCGNENTLSCANSRVNLTFSGDRLLVLKNIWDM